MASEQKQRLKNRSTPKEVSRRDTLGLIGKTSLVALLASACRIDSPPIKNTDPERPNIVYIHSHDTGRYTEPYGHHISTPNLQKFADEGMVFRQAFSASPTCSPSRASLFTGMTPGCNGMWGLAHHKGSNWRLNDYSQTFVQMLKHVGYTTTIAGIQHILSGLSAKAAAETIGYNTLVKSSWSVPFTAEQAAGYLDRLGSPKQPFFLDVGFIATHVLTPTPTGSHFGYENGDPRKAEAIATLRDTPETQQDVADFAVAADVFDTAVGKILQSLERNSLADNTLVMITTDHGIPLPGMKANHTDGGLGVGLIFRGPKGFSGGKVSNALVSQIDVFPTLCELLELPKPAWLQGKSLMPLVRGEVDEINEAVFAEYEEHAVLEPQASVRTKRYKYIRRLDGNDEPRPANTDLTYTKDLWLKEGWDEHLVVPEQLYDLEIDPLEKHNLAVDPRHGGVLSDMRRLMVARMEKYDNPLLRKYNVADAPPEKRVLPVVPPLAPQSLDSSNSEFGVIYTGE